MIRYLHNKQQTNIRALSGIQTRDPSGRRPHDLNRTSTDIGPYFGFPVGIPAQFTMGLKNVKNDKGNDLQRNFCRIFDDAAAKQHKPHAERSSNVQSAI
jgi:hypothetical protein